MHFKFTADLMGLKLLKRPQIYILNFTGKPYDWKTETWDRD